MDRFLLKIQKRHERFFIENPSKSLLYNDCFLGSLDKDYENEGKILFKEYAEKIREVAGEFGEFSYIFTTLSSLCELVAVKADLGLLTRKGYQAGDKEKLAELIGSYKTSEKLLEVFYRQFKDLWFRENKPPGWEVQDARLGGLMCRIRSCRERLSDYVDGKISEIPELEETILPFGEDLFRDNYSRIITTSKL